jgi:hypothetical protein
MSDHDQQSRRGSFTIREWCEFRRISSAMFYKMDSQGLAPRTHYAGAKRLISGEADHDWIREREADNSVANVRQAARGEATA